MFTDGTHLVTWNIQEDSFGVFSLYCLCPVGLSSKVWLVELSEFLLISQMNSVKYVGGNFLINERNVRLLKGRMLCWRKKGRWKKKKKSLVWFICVFKLWNIRNQITQNAQTKYNWLVQINALAQLCTWVFLSNLRENNASKQIMALPDHH